MRKTSLFLTILVPVLWIENPGWCAGSNATAFKLSVTLPQTIGLISEQKTVEATQTMRNAPQIVQEERLKRDNRMLSVKSIVSR
jgi:hypothetical protein